MDAQRDDSDLEFQLSRYLDGQLGRRESAELRRRLRRDPAASEQLRQYAALAGQLAEMGNDRIEGVEYEARRAEIIAAMERRVLRGHLPHRRVVFRPALAAAAAAAAVIVMVGLWVWFARPPAPAGPVVIVRVLPAGADVSNGARAVVELVPIPWEQVRLAPPQEPDAQAALPAGTVMVSIGSADEGPPDPLAPELPIGL